MNKNDILDWVIELEDEKLKNLREFIITSANEKYGNEGKEIAEKYYRQIDGEEDFDDQDIKDCDDCKERALKLIKISESLKVVSDLLVSDLLDKLSKEVNLIVLKEMIYSILNNSVELILKKSCFKLNSEKKNDLMKKLLLDVVLLKEEDQNGSSV